MRADVEGTGSPAAAGLKFDVFLDMEAGAEAFTVGAELAGAFLAGAVLSPSVSSSSDPLARLPLRSFAGLPPSVIAVYSGTLARSGRYTKRRPG